MPRSRAPLAVLLCLLCLASLPPLLAADEDVQPYLTRDREVLQALAMSDGAEPPAVDKLRPHGDAMLELGDPVLRAHAAVFPLLEASIRGDLGADLRRTNLLPEPMRIAALTDALKAIEATEERPGEDALPTMQRLLMAAAFGTAAGLVVRDDLPPTIVLRKGFVDDTAPGRPTAWEAYVVEQPAAEHGFAEVWEQARKWVQTFRSAVDESAALLGPEQTAKLQPLLEQAETAVAAGTKSVRRNDGSQELLTARFVVRHEGAGAEARVSQIRCELAWPVAAPMFMHAADKGKESNCLSNVKQLALGFLQYEQDNERFPKADNWLKPITAYVGSEAVRLCPMDEAPIGGLSYFYNAALSGRTFGSLSSPSQTILLAEGEAGSGGPERLRARHDGQVIVGFADGHVKRMSLEEARNPELWRAR